MLPSATGRDRFGITSASVYPDYGTTRKVLEELLEHARPGTMTMPLTVQPVKAKGPSPTLSGLAGYRIVSVGARTTRTAALQVAELNAVAARLASERTQVRLSA